MKAAPTPYDLIKRWGISVPFAARLHQVLEHFRWETGLEIEVISGFRTIEEQNQLTRDGRPTALSPYLSTHTSCPATGADIRIGGPLYHVVPAVKATFGRLAVFYGLRWGGGSAIDSATGIPSDWNHVDMGPRNDACAQQAREQL